MSIPFLISACCFPVVGLVLDKLGKRLNLLATAGCLLIATHCTFMLIYPVGPLIMLGLSYSLFGAIVWPTVAYIVDSRSLGTAYGIQTSLQNLGLTIAPMIIAYIRTSTPNYNYVLLYFAIMGAVGVFITLELITVDAKFGRNLPTILCNNIMD
jgi:MFS family permease